MFLNDDVILGDTFFQDIVKPFADKTVALVGCQASQKPWGVNGAVMCIRREVFEMIGGFDERYFFMWEDRDLCENIRRRGYKIAISNAQAEHKGNASAKETPFYRKHYAEGQRYFEQKWHDDSRIIGMMTVGNEEGRYLEMAVDDLFARDLIDELVIVGDAPTDKTPEICKDLSKRHPVTYYHHDFKLFGTAQNKLRMRLTHYAISKHPFGLLAPDADEIFDEELTREKELELLANGIGWDFMVCHYWGDTKHIRIDGMWGHQKNVRLFRYLPQMSQKFSDKPIHCGSSPWYAYKWRKMSDMLFYHFGYIRQQDVQMKVDRYAKHDPHGTWEAVNWYDDMKKDGNIIKFNKLQFKKIWQT